jgi:uncharacterized membrane protein
MGHWLEHTVTVDIAAPVEQVWEVWSDLESMPLWMRWIESVVTLDDPDLTEWTLVAQGFRFQWQARITERVDRQQLHWQSVGGLPTRGAVRFYLQGADRTAVKLTVAYELPAMVAPLMDAGLLGGLVTKELQANLDRFKTLVEQRAATP